MPSLSIITPWSGDTAQELAGDYYNAVADTGAEVITIDNASAPATAAALREMTAQLYGQYHRNDTNLGFSAGNNQGYALATPPPTRNEHIEAEHQGVPTELIAQRDPHHIIVFLNSDIAAPPSWLRAVAADVRDGALYGPALQYQLVAGRWIPYLSGWCVAATRATWERLRHIDTTISDVPGHLHLDGPWNAVQYPHPYWEDNDLSLRALQAGLSLIQTAWPIQHKEGRTAGGLARHAESFERNRAMFRDRAMYAFSAVKPIAESAIQHRYRLAAAQQSDIQHHLPLLYSLARGNVLELGTRTGVSTAALLAGVEARGGHVWSVDTEDCSALYAGHPQWEFVRGDSTLSRTSYEVMGVEYSPPDHKQTHDGFDLILLDTLHSYEHVKTELEVWEDTAKPGGTICVHDPETFPGVRRAVTEFCAAQGWDVTFVLPCNGMAVIEVPK